MSINLQLSQKVGPYENIEHLPCSAQPGEASWESGMGGSSSKFDDADSTLFPLMKWSFQRTLQLIDSLLSTGCWTLQHPRPRKQR